MAWRRAYMKIQCEFCGKSIARNRYGWHLRNHCPKAKEHYKKERLEEIKKLPIEELTFGEAEESGRLNELKEYLDR